MQTLANTRRMSLEGGVLVENFEGREGAEEGWAGLKLNRCVFVFI